MLRPLLEAIALAAGLGLLVGLQRERSDPRLAGLRTFPMICVFGVLCAAVAPTLGGWTMAGGLVALAAVIVIGNLMAARRDAYHEGVTTEVAMLVMFGVGALLVTGPREAAVVVGGGLAVTLYAKPVLKRFTEKFNDNDVRAIMQLALVSLVILPVLPDRTFGPYDVLNLRQIWWMVVLVVGVSLSAYIAQKLMGAGRGTLAAGIFGGLISSTATTISFARRTSSQRRLEEVAVAVVLLAQTVLHGRVIFEMFVVGRSVAPTMALPVGAAGLVAAVIGIVAWLRVRSASPPEAENENPAELRTALVFAAIYAGVLLLLAVVREHFGTGSLYVVAALSGVTDMDAITLSTTRLAADGQVEPGVAWRAVLIAAVANTIFKLGAIWVLGSPRLGRLASIGFGIYVAAGVVILLVWP